MSEIAYFEGRSHIEINTFFCQKKIVLIEITNGFFLLYFSFKLLIVIIILSGPPREMAISDFGIPMTSTSYSNRSDQSATCHVFSNKPKIELSHFGDSEYNILKIYIVSMRVPIYIKKKIEIIIK